MKSQLAFKIIDCFESLIGEGAESQEVRLVRQNGAKSAASQSVD